MSIRFSCSCGRKLKVSDEKIGMKVLCSSCGATLKVPKKSQDEYWQDVPAKSDQPKVDYVATFREIAFQIVPGAALIILAVWGAYYLSSQIIVGRGNLPPLGSVSGTVKLDGKPLANATVRFIPLDDSGKMDRKGASAALGLTDDSGHYRLIYVKDTMGAAVGQNRVEIQAHDNSGRGRGATRIQRAIDIAKRSEIRIASAGFRCSRRRLDRFHHRDCNAKSPALTLAPSREWRVPFDGFPTGNGHKLCRQRTPPPTTLRFALPPRAPIATANRPRRRPRPLAVTLSPRATCRIGKSALSSRRLSSRERDWRPCSAPEFFWQARRSAPANGYSARPSRPSLAERSCGSRRSALSRRRFTTSRSCATRCTAASRSLRGISDWPPARSSGRPSTSSCASPTSGPSWRPTPRFRWRRPCSAICRATGRCRSVR